MSAPDPENPEEDKSMPEVDVDNEKYLEFLAAYIMHSELMGHVNTLRPGLDAKGDDPDEKFDYSQLGPRYKKENRDYYGFFTLTHVMFEL